MPDTNLPERHGHHRAAGGSEDTRHMAALERDMGEMRATLARLLGADLAAMTEELRRQEPAAPVGTE